MVTKLHQFIVAETHVRSVSANRKALSSFSGLNVSSSEVLDKIAVMYLGSPLTHKVCHQRFIITL